MEFHSEKQDEPTNPNALRIALSQKTWLFKRSVGMKSRSLARRSVEEGSTQDTSQPFTIAKGEGNGRKREEGQAAVAA